MICMVCMVVMLCMVVCMTYQVGRIGGNACTHGGMHVDVSRVMVCMNDIYVKYA